MMYTSGYEKNKDKSQLLSSKEDHISISARKSRMSLSFTEACSYIGQALAQEVGRVPGTHSQTMLCIQV